MKKVCLILMFLFPILLTAQDHYPEWAQGAVWYQIFPERFANGDTTNDPTADKVFLEWPEPRAGWKVTDWTSNWFERDEWMTDEFDDIYMRRYGGDIQGIINRLDYVKDLGIEAVYLNPVFEAVSLHKYDASMFHHIDVNFGPDPEGDRKLMADEEPGDPETWVWTSADSLFLELVKEVHKRGMKIVIDGVFNHTGRQFWAFQDILKKQEKSRYTDWYDIHGFDDPATADTNEFDYEGWWGVKTLPEIGRTENNLNKGPRDYFFAITKKWMDPDGDPSTNDGIDGWRLDVANEVPTGFWEEWSPYVKSINPDAIIIGELWDMSPHLVGTDKVFDSRMNYNFAYATVYYMISQGQRENQQAFIDSLKSIREAYNFKTELILQNLLGSHDTERFASMIVNPGRQFDRGARHDNPEFSPAKPTAEEYELMKTVAAFQMFYLGAPMIYYGDEVGMWGGDDPYDRKPMVWADMEYDPEVITEESRFAKGHGSYEVKPNEDLLAYYKEIISIRENNPVIKYGDVEFVYTDSLAFGIRRYSENEEMFFFFNVGDNETTIQTENLTESLYRLSNGIKEEKINGSFTLPGRSAVILSAKGLNLD